LGEGKIFHTGADLLLVGVCGVILGEGGTIFNSGGGGADFLRTGVDCFLLRVVGVDLLLGGGELSSQGGG
jgi:hypothetical protein